jgi:hypothetical protein
LEKDLGNDKNATFRMKNAGEEEKEKEKEKKSVTMNQCKPFTLKI